jgi:hypothetical protein
LVNAASDMGAPDQPNNNEGWGRILLDDALYFQGDTRELHAEDEKVGLATGEQATYSYEVDSSTEPLEVTLVWTDYPAVQNASPALVNNLDLVVQSPTAATYLGNVYSGGQSGSGGSSDNANVEECVRRNTPELGVWTVTVTAANVPQGGHQPFALVTTGGFANWPQASAGVQSASAVTHVLLDPARPNPFLGATRLSFSLPSAGPANLSVYDVGGRLVATLAAGQLAAGPHQYDWNGRIADGGLAPSGTYLYRLQAGSTTVTRKMALVR